VRRAVWERDRGQCTFVGDNGHRCTARRVLEFDHIEPVARGGRASVEGIRLRCRVHNQYEAERVYGAGFMDMKRDEARRERELRSRRADATGTVAGTNGRSASATGASHTAQPASAKVMHAAPPRTEAAQLAPPMKAGCQDPRSAIHSYRDRRSPAVYSGSTLLPQDSLRSEQGPTRGNGLRTQGASRDHLLTIQRRLR
jgi:hypothetical protein